ncbi:hypothetical protein EYC98_17020 [Halieaceae bacterium IMCC14734]|uniref:Uncharacterized protein n=1 Tax=Candidatus Litorirhabdus singularis TaxID=2518993 RepID=A0ABT3TJT7_9GAMM|nr:hypothetical protein [Candidatus Litorirhabdus singularis]MCX2982567.1 hypothetical protein [Candidatus Litorirhabdus singularis]
MVVAVAREFSEQELERAGIPSVELQRLALQTEDFPQLRVLQLQLLQEAKLIIGSYRGWEQRVLDTLEQLAGSDVAQSALDEILDFNKAPERELTPETLVDTWKAETELALAAGEAGLYEEQLQRSAALHDEVLRAHDGMMSRITALLSILYRGWGIEPLQQVLEAVMQPQMLDPGGNLPFRERVQRLIAFTRCHLQPFSLSEDDEKVTFRPHTCPSGARLIQQGAYSEQRGGALVQEPGPLTYGRDNLPIYCCHEPAAEIAAIKHFGAPLFMVEPAADLARGPCIVHMYKVASNIPERYYQRLGLKKPTDLIAVGSDH